MVALDGTALRHAGSVESYGTFPGSIRAASGDQPRWSVHRQHQPPALANVSRLSWLFWSNKVAVSVGAHQTSDLVPSISLLRLYSLFVQIPLQSPNRFLLYLAKMGFIDLFQDTGLTGEFLLIIVPIFCASWEQSYCKSPLCTSLRPRPLTNDSVLNSWLTTRSYIVG